MMGWCKTVAMETKAQARRIYKRLGIPMTRREYFAVQRLAKMAGMKMATYVRVRMVPELSAALAQDDTQRTATG